MAESCDGAAKSCPGDGLAAAGTECRAAADQCDAAEVCAGDVASCPSDLPAFDGSPCDDGDACAGDTCQAGVCAASSCGPPIELHVVPNVGNAGWTQVALARTYAEMVVACTPNYSGADPASVARVDNAAGASFEVRMETTNGAGVAGVTVHCLVAEAGTYTVAADGLKMEAVTYTSTVTDRKGSWVAEARPYSQPYTNPVVVGQVMTDSAPDDDGNWSVFWASDGNKKDPPSSAGLRAGKHVAEDPDTARADETVGYFVFEAGSGSIGSLDYVAALGGDVVQGVDDAPPYSYAIAGLSTVAGAVVSQAAMDGGNGGWAFLYGANAVTTNALFLAVDEDQANDAERKHTSEQAGYVVFGTP